MAQSRDGCVVPTEQLAELLDGFITSWNRTRPQNAGSFSAGESERTDVVLMGAVAWLSEQTRRADPQGEGLKPDRILRIAMFNRSENRRSSQRGWTELRIADALLTAIGRPDVLSDGTVTIEPNEIASREARMACADCQTQIASARARFCCGGSTTTVRQTATLTGVLLRRAR